MAKDLGDVEAMLNLGALYEEDKDLKQAVACYK
jgi:hypothetical protein